MSFMDALSISSTGLSAQRLRMNLISSNLANAQTTRTEEGGPYRRREAVFAARPLDSDFNRLLASHLDPKLAQVQVVRVVEDPRPPILKFDPDHPDANDQGYVALPNIQVLEEMVNMITASRSYEANVAAVKATKAMALRALEIGR
ncbi:MAG: flagellar basal body rod protein FlgC [Desulfobacterales bacterium]